MINLARQLFFTEEKMKSINLLKQLLKKTSTGKMIKSILIKIQKIKEALNQVIKAGYVMNCLLQEITK